MSTVIEQPRTDVPIVADATLLAVPNMNDEAARTEYLQKIRALRNTSKEAVSSNVKEEIRIDIQPETSIDEPVDEPSGDAIQPDSQPQDTSSSRTRLSKDDLRDYEIPVTNENGEVEYLSYEEFEKTVGLYSKQNKRARELADREREVEALKTNLLTQSNNTVDRINKQEVQMTERYQWVQNSLAFAHQHGVDIVKFEDGSTKKVTQLIAEKTAIETQAAKLQADRAAAQQKLDAASKDFIRVQDEVLEQKAPSVKKARNDITKFLERQGFTKEESQALAHAKAELLILFDKAMKYENAVNSQSKEKKVSTNTKVIKQASRLAGRGTQVNSSQTTRAQELQSLGTKATPDQLRELRRLQLQRK
jgi:hypothetical protein